MNDDDLQTILRHGEGRVELPSDVEGRIRLAMSDELDRTLHPDGSVVSLRSVRSRGPRRRSVRTWVAAAILLLLGAVALFVGNDETEPASPEPRVVVSPPYLRSCLEFTRATSEDGAPWPEILAGLDVGEPMTEEYLVRLAHAIDALVDSRNVAPAEPQLRLAAAAARRPEPDVARIARLLEMAQDLLTDETAIPCLTEESG